MSKKDPFRFTVKLDSTDKEHREVAAYLNRIGRRKARVIVKAVQAYLWENGEEERETASGPAMRSPGKDRAPDKKDRMAKNRIPDGSAMKIETVEAGEREAVAENFEIHSDGVHHLDMDDEINGYQIDQAELELMRRNFEKLRKEG